ncbi:RidA family protein [Actinokineospora auranticolor]|uniref:Enamine deaminase RidA (YjgF/YER057c/UK114 family) n=1 Tax=Actinokineospora auranticolor TaxID=155976 RepID=A0A2S6GER6_9PSEU|nr:RidA family protein [Actinokineospora auranticolor]PPK63596.1 enamine deaminase RidA (YjgF/YER057c/UK114 family) [Actinokineospora auranticolor]
MTPHRIVTAPDLAPPVGFAHAVVAAPGRTVHLGGQTAQDPTGAIVGETMAEQFDRAAGNVVSTLTAAGSEAPHLVSVIIYVTSVAAYKAALPELGPLWRKHFGKHYPAVALLGVAELFDTEAMIELVATAVIPT